MTPKQCLERVISRLNIASETQVSATRMGTKHLYIGVRSYNTINDGLELYNKAASVRTLFTYCLERNGANYNFLVNNSAAWRPWIASYPELITWVNTELLLPLTGNRWTLIFEEPCLYLCNDRRQTLPMTDSRRIWNCSMVTEAIGTPLPHMPKRYKIPKPEATAEELTVKISPRAARTVTTLAPTLEGQFEPDKDYSDAETDMLIVE